MSLINKDGLVERIENYIIGCPIYSDKIKSFVKEILEAEIKHIPTIEPVKRGKWIDDGDCFICSNCRKAFGFLSAKCVTNFCPDCGAKMDNKKSQRIEEDILEEEIWKEYSSGSGLLNSFK